MKYIFLFLLLLIPFATSISLDSTVVLNTTVSNSSMTFNENITCDRILIENNMILLYNTSCSITGKFLSQYSFSSENSNIDSMLFCSSNIGEAAQKDGGSSYKLFEKLEIYNIWKEIKEFFKKLFMRDDCSLFGINIGKIFGLCWYFWIILFLFLLVLLLIFRKILNIRMPFI